MRCTVRPHLVWPKNARLARERFEAIAVVFILVRRGNVTRECAPCRSGGAMQASGWGRYGDGDGGREGRGWRW